MAGAGALAHLVGAPGGLMPIFVPRYTPEYGQLASIYAHGGDQLARISLQRGATQA